MHRTLILVVLCLFAGTARAAAPATQPSKVALTAPVGPRGEPKRVKSLMIDKPGVYEDYLIDAEWADADAVRIKADNVTLRNCEIRNGRRDAVEVYAKDVVIENCKIHHFLAGTFEVQKDAHGITGQPTRLTVRNCEIGYLSGDCLQFDPGRKPWTDVVIENCRLFAAPLPADAAEFKKGQSPGENGVDTKQDQKNPRSKITVRNCVVHGFSKGGQIGNRAALNLKNHIEAIVENCQFYDNEIALRLRGPGKGGNKYGGAHVTATDCAFYDTQTVIRAEDVIERAVIVRPQFGDGVERKVQHVGGQSKGFQMTDERTPGKRP